MLTNKAKAEILKMETFAKFPYLIEISTASGDIYRFCNSFNDLTFGGEVYTSALFDIQRPDISETAIGNASINLSGIDSFWIEKIREETKRAKLKFIASIEYTDDNAVDTIEAIEESEFILTLADWDLNSVSWVMVFDEGLNVMIPCDVADSIKCPGCA